MGSYVVRDLLWGKYKGFDGWYTMGPSYPMVVSASDPASKKSLKVVVSTESIRNNAGAVNAYDSCVISIGDLQLCQTYQLGTDLIGYLVTEGFSLTPIFSEAMKASGVIFRRTPAGKWRFYRGSTIIEGNDLNREIYFAGDSGIIGTWGNAGKERAALWVAAFQEMLVQSDAAVEAQRRFLENRIHGYMLPDARNLLWGKGTPDKEASGWVGALRSTFLSFSVNNSVIAQNNLMRAATNLSSADLFTERGFVEVVRSLTFGEGNPIIYPKRYEDIRPVLETLYGVDLPDTRKDLKNWAVPLSLRLTAKEIQAHLIRHGYDLGPAGADGILGKKSIQAIKEFQADWKLPISGNVGVAEASILVG